MLFRLYRKHRVAYEIVIHLLFIGVPLTVLDIVLFWLGASTQFLMALSFTFIFGAILPETITYFRRKKEA